jgi:integrase
VQSHAAITDKKALGGLLRSIDAFDGYPTTKAALQLMALLYPRPGELRQAEWSEFDLEAKVWTIPATRAKMRRAHRVPLPDQAVDILRQVYALTGRGMLVVPSVRSAKRPMSENTLNAALRRLGYTKHEMTSHGFRATFSTISNESGLWNPDAIERALAHVEANAIRRAYLRGEHWDERVRMAQWWADLLDKLRVI